MYIIVVTSEPDRDGGRQARVEYENGAHTLYLRYNTRQLDITNIYVVNIASRLQVIVVNLNVYVCIIEVVQFTKSEQF